VTKRKAKGSEKGDINDGGKGEDKRMRRNKKAGKEKGKNGRKRQTGNSHPNKLLLAPERA